ncbi:MAG: hypothetical protein WCX77_03015 [Candidatus Paceibacterota bacterium]
MNTSLISQIIFFSVSIIGLWLAFWVYFSHKGKETKYFFWMVLSWIGVMISYFLFRNASLPKEVVAYAPMPGLALVFLFFSFFYFFTINFLKEENKFPVLDKLIPVISVIGFSLCIFLPDLFRKSIIFTKEGLGQDLSITLEGKIFWLGFVAIMTLFIFSRFLINYSKADSGNKSKIKYFLAGLSIWIAVNLVFNVYFPIVKDTFKYAYWANNSIIVLFGFTAYAIVKNELFGIKVILTQLLVFGMGIILAGLPFFMPSLGLQIATTFIFLISCLIGYLLIKATLKETRKKEVLAGMVQDRTKELEQSKKVAEERAAELEKWYNLTIGRELRMVELKEKIKAMEQKTIK